MAITEDTEKLIRKRALRIHELISNVDRDVSNLESIVEPKNNRINDLKAQKIQLEKEEANIRKDLQ